MKKVILLLVAVMIASVSFADGNGHKGGKKHQKGRYMDDNDATVTQVGMFNKAYIDQTDATKSFATITTVGNGNDAVIKQVGSGNVAGGAIWANTDICGGFNAGVIPNYVPTFGGGTWMCSVDVACCYDIPAQYYSFDLMPVLPGIYVVGDDNTTTISQAGHGLIAGLVVVGDDNTAKIDQKGWGNLASTWIVGKDNKTNIKQSHFSAYNAAFQKVIGEDNEAYVEQSGFGNLMVQNVSNKKNKAYASQSGVGNIGLQDVSGCHNTVLLQQDGWFNKSVQQTAGKGNTSLVQQSGMMNQATIVQ